MRKWFLLLAAVLVLTGCESASKNRLAGAHGYLPELPVAPRPKLDELTPEEVQDVKEKLQPPTQAKIMGNVKKLMEWGAKNELSIDYYNNYAKFNNAFVRKELGLPPKVEEKESKQVEVKPDE